MDKRRAKGRRSGQEFTQVIVPELPPQFQYLHEGPIQAQCSVILSSLDNIESYINGKNCDDDEAVIFFRENYTHWYGYFITDHNKITGSIVKKLESARMMARVIVCYCSLCFLSTREGARDLVPYILMFEDAWENKKAPVSISKLKGCWCKQFFNETMFEVQHPINHCDFKDLDELIQQLRSVGITFCVDRDFERASIVFAAADYVSEFQPSQSDEFERLQKICAHFISARKDVDLELIMPLVWHELKWTESPDPKAMNEKKNEWSRDFVDKSVKRFNKSVGAKVVKTDQLIKKLISIGDGFVKEGKYAEAKSIFVDASYICVLFGPTHLSYVNYALTSCGEKVKRSTKSRKAISGANEESGKSGPTTSSSRTDEVAFDANKGANQSEENEKSGPTTSFPQVGKLTSSSQTDEVAFDANKGANQSEENEKSGPTTSSPQVGKLGDKVGAPPRADAFLETNLVIHGMGMSIIKVKENEELYHGTVDVGGVSLKVSVIIYTDLLTAKRVYADLFDTLCHYLLKPQHCPFQASFLGVERAIFITPKLTTWELFLENAYKKHEKAVSPFDNDMGGLSYEDYVRMLRGIFVGLSCLLRERISFDAWSMRIYISDTHNIPLVLPWPCFEGLHSESKGSNVTYKWNILPKTVMKELSCAIGEAFKFGNPLGEEDRFYELKCLLDQLEIKKWRGRNCPRLILSNPCVWTMEERYNFLLKFRNFYNRSLNLLSHFETYALDNENSIWISCVENCDDDALKGVLQYTPEGKGQNVDEGGSSLGDAGAMEYKDGLYKEWEYMEGTDVVRFVCNCFRHYNQHNKRVRIDELQILEIIMGIIPKMFMFLVRGLLAALDEERQHSDSFYEEIEGLFVDF